MSEGIGGVVDETWAFIDENGVVDLCILSNGDSRYLFSGRSWDNNPFVFDGDVYDMPSDEVLRVTPFSDYENALCTQEKAVGKVRGVLLENLFSLGEYVYEGKVLKKLNLGFGQDPFCWD